MAELEKMQKLRQIFIENLDDMKSEAYSGLTCVEYDAINTLKIFIQMHYKLDDIKENNNG